MNKKVIITGATGMVGKGILLECLDHRDISEVLIIVRNPINMDHPKLKELIQKDFSDFSKVKDQLKGYDACFYSLGISAAGLNEQQYKRISYDFTMALAKTLFEINPEMTFNYVSGQGTDSSEKGRMMWARVKGKTENDLLKLGFKQAYMFRPGVIIPLRGIKSRTKSYQFMYNYFMWLVIIIKAVAPNSVVNTTQIGMAMIHSTFKGYDKKVLKPVDIISFSK
nr:epimerase [Bacteroidota bacterium]